MACGCKKKKVNKPVKPKKNLTQQQQESLVKEVINRINKLS
jgi:hypothetical protein